MSRLSARRRNPHQLAAQPSSGHAAREVLRKLVPPIYAPSFIYAVGTGALAPMIVLVALAMGFTDSHASAIVGVGGLVSVISSPIMGSVISRHSERASMITASVVACTALSGALLALSFPGRTWSKAVYVGTIVVLSIAQNVYSLARQSYIAQSIPPIYRPRAMATFGGMIRLGNLTGPALGSVVVGLWTLGAVFVLHIGTALVAMTLIIVFTLPRPQSLVDGPTRRSSDSTIEDGSVDSATSSGSVQRPDWMPPARETVDLPATVIVGLGITCLSLARANRNVLIPLWGASLNLDASTISLVWAIAAVVDVAMFYPSGVLMERFGRLAVLAPTLGLMGAAFLALPLTYSTVTFVLGACLVSFGAGFGSGILMTTGADLAPDHDKVKFLGYWNAVGNFGNMLGPFLAAWLTQHHGLRSAIWGTGIIAVAAAIWLLFTMRWAYARLGMNTRAVALASVRSGKEKESR